MNKILILLSLLLLSLNVMGQERFLVGGASSDKIAIIGRSTQQVEWEHAGFEDECKGCNSLIYTDKGNILYAHKSGAYMINIEKELLWSVGIEQGEELQCVSAIKGGFLVGIAGSPMRILELDHKGRVTKEVSYQTEVQNIHRQFRQISKSRKGSYLVPVSDKKKIVELDRKGRVKREVNLEKSSLYVIENRAGDWIATTGHAGQIYKIDGRSAEITKVVEQKQLSDTVTIEFGAGITELKNGNYLLANWVGHNGNASQPVLIEFNDKWEVVWTMPKPEGYTFVAGVDPIY